MGAGNGELVAANELPVIAKPLFDAVVLEDGGAHGCLADSTGTSESDR